MNARQRVKGPTTKSNNIANLNGRIARRLPRKTRCTAKGPGLAAAVFSPSFPPIHQTRADLRHASPTHIPDNLGTSVGQ